MGTHRVTATGQILHPILLPIRGPSTSPALSRFFLASAQDTHLKNVGPKDLDGRLVQQVKLTAVASDAKQQTLEDSSSEFRVFIDPESQFVVKIESFLLAPDTPTNRTLVETYYSDYRRVNGVAVPFRISRSLAGQKDSEIVFNQVSVIGATISVAGEAK
jgi:hypothetical protein